MTEWRPVPGWEGYYEVSDNGRLRSVPRTVIRSDFGKPWRYRGIEQEPYVGNHGYLVGALSRGNKGERVLIHNLVCEAFHGPRPDGAYARHLNDVRTDNRVENLAWGTPSENAHDAVRNGGHYWSSRDACHKGHPFDEENSYVNKRGARICRQCARENSREKRAHKREENPPVRCGVITKAGNPCKRWALGAGTCGKH